MEIDPGLLWTPPSDTPRDSTVPSGATSEPSYPVTHRGSAPPPPAMGVILAAGLLISCRATKPRGCHQAGIGFSTSMDS